jgi:LPS export ABC transporter permease LptF/LPS export ABC transporter permease LptG
MDAIHSRTATAGDAGGPLVILVIECRASSMRIIDRHICRAVLSHALLGLAVLTFVFFVPQMARIMQLVARHSAPMSEIGMLLLAAFPGILTFTIPMSLLIGILIGLGALSSDSELIAMNATGMGLRRLLVPVGIAACAAAAVTIGMTFWLGPIATHRYRAASELLRTGQASFEIQPRVFDERFPHTVLYVKDVSAAATRWIGVFLVESDPNDVSRLTVAKDAIVVADQNQNKLELHLKDGSTHESSINDAGNYSLSGFGQRDLAITVGAENGGPRILAPINAELPVRELLAKRGADARAAAIELHRRVVFPVACLALPLMALPLAARPRRGSRSGGFLLALVLIVGYYVVFTIGAGLSRDGALPPWFGIWAANIGAVAAGLAMLPGITKMPDASLVERIFGRFSFRPATVADVPNPASSSLTSRDSPAPSRGLLAWRLRPASGKIPQLIDFYLLRNFIFYFTMLLVGFLVLFEAFNFFELLDDIAQHRVPSSDVLTYFAYLAFYLFYQLAPLACVVAVLVTLGIMAKNNELVALKAAGVSLYRVALPLVLAGFFLAGGLVELDNVYLPYANQRQDALRNQIQGRPAQTFYQPQRSWIVGDDSRIYNYELFDSDHSLFGRLNIYELDPDTFAVRRRIYAERARWVPDQRVWALSSGWVRTFSPTSVALYKPFSEQTFLDLREPPQYFRREVRQGFQMNWPELRRYINDLSQAGFDVARLSVQLHRKLAFPLIAPIVMLLAVPFSLAVGNRGAVGGLAAGVGIAVFYWAASALLEALGAVGQLPPVLAAWSPDAAFFFVALYFFLRMPT